MTAPSRFSRQTMMMLIERAKGVCERCDRRPVSADGGQAHHRCPAKSGGSKVGWIAQPSNGAALCKPCHDEVESNRDEALNMGWLISRIEADAHGRTAADYPIKNYRGDFSVWVYLLDNGWVSPIKPQVRNDW